MKGENPLKNSSISVDELRKKSIPPPNIDESKEENNDISLVPTEKIPESVIDNSNNTSNSIDHNNDEFEFRKKIYNSTIENISLTKANKTKTFRPKSNKPIYLLLSTKCNCFCQYAPDDTFFINLALESLDLLLKNCNEIDNELFKIKNELSSKVKDEEKKALLENFFMDLFKKHIR